FRWATTTSIPRGFRARRILIGSIAVPSYSPGIGNEVTIKMRIFGRLHPSSTPWLLRGNGSRHFSRFSSFLGGSPASTKDQLGAIQGFFSFSRKGLRRHETTGVRMSPGGSGVAGIGLAGRAESNLPILRPRRKRWESVGRSVAYVYPSTR